MADTVRVPVVLDSPPHDAAGVVVCRLTGEIDIDCRDEVRQSFSQAVARATEAVVVDCTGLEFCDSTLLNALIQLHRQAQARGLGVALAAPRTQLLRLLTLTGTANLLPTHRTVARALRAADGKPRGVKVTAGLVTRPDGRSAPGPHRAAPLRPAATPRTDRTPRETNGAVPGMEGATSSTHASTRGAREPTPATHPATTPTTHERDALEQALCEAEGALLATSWNLTEGDREALQALLAEVDASAAAPHDRTRLAEACAAVAIAARQVRGLPGRLLGDCAAALRPALHPQAAPVTAPQAATALRRIRDLVAHTLR
ncbi:STAS domain-containing protein [Streptomyces sp. NPDC086023]|uniref:STAS domain-containing protein n=1 Tax=Streptomyces sp. NPDC086023 TaxID=3365746 RepID=UPI0037CD7232